MYRYVHVHAHKHPHVTQVKVHVHVHVYTLCSHSSHVHVMVVASFPGPPLLCTPGKCEGGKEERRQEPGKSYHVTVDATPLSVLQYDAERGWHLPSPCDNIYQALSVIPPFSALTFLCVCM